LPAKNPKRKDSKNCAKKPNEKAPLLMLIKLC
jgi:hypothetical protein